MTAVPRVVLCLTVLVAAGCAEPEEATAPGPPRSASPAAAEFLRICQELRDSADPFYGQAQSRELESRLETPPADRAGLASLKALLGRERLKLGRTADSVELLTQAVDLAVRAEMDPRVILDMRVYLGLAHLQAAEDRNCLQDHTAASCIFPFTPEAIHRVRSHARAAGDVFAEVAREFPRAVQTLWLLNLSRVLSGDYPDGVEPRFRLPAASLTRPPGFPRWTNRAPYLGLGVVDLAGGAVIDDFDGDGLLDIVTSTWDPCDSLKAFRNDGSGGFQDVTRAWGLDEQLGGLNLVHADYDGDGRIDLLVLRGAWMGPLGRIRNSLLRNELSNGEGFFVDKTHAAGLADPAYPTQTAAWADFDLDGDLDLYVGNEDPDGKSYPSQLFRNRGDGSFDEVGTIAGVANHRFAKAVAWGDYDDDGDPDLYVSNIGPNRLFRNDAGIFTDVAPQLDVTRPEGRSFGSWFFDHDNDGDLDLFVVDYESPVPAVAAFYFGLETPPNRPHLYRNDGQGFTEISRQAGLARPLLPMGVNYGDLDNDGWLDIYLGTGEPGYETVMPNVMFRNDGGKTFLDVTASGGFGHLQKGHGVAFGDLDNDGDQDLLHQLGGFFPGDSYANALFENPTRASSWITLLLAGARANPFAIGARIAVEIREPAGGRRTIHSLVGSGGSFGGSSLRQEIGLGKATAIDAIRVRWPAGREEIFTGAEPGYAYRLVEGSGRLEPVALRRLSLAPATPAPTR